MKIHRTKIQNTRFVIFWCLAVLLEAPLFYAFFNIQNSISSANFYSFAISHLLSAITLFFSYPKYSNWLHFKRNWAVFFFFIVLFLPLFGHIICAATYFFCNENPNTDLLFEEDQIFMTKNKYRLILQNINSSSWIDRARQAVDFLPLVDILEGNDLSLKRSAIDRIGEMIPKHAIELLKKYSSDNSPEVRFYVTSAISKIKKRLEDDIEATKIQYHKDMDQIEFRLDLAKSYLRYCESGLLDTQGNEIYSDEAIKHLRQIITSNPDQTEAYKLLYKELSNREKWQDILDLLSHSNYKGKIPEIDSLKTQALCHFNLGQYAELFTSLKELKQEKDIETDWMATINWLGVES